MASIIPLARYANRVSRYKLERLPAWFIALVKESEKREKERKKEKREWPQRSRENSVGNSRRGRRKRMGSLKSQKRKKRRVNESWENLFRPETNQACFSLRFCGLLQILLLHSPGSIYPFFKLRANGRALVWHTDKVK